MTSPRIEAAARALCNQNGHDPDGQDSYVQSGMDANWCAFKGAAKAALAAADAAAWRPIEEYSLNMGQVYCGHSEKKWLRHGRMIPGHGSRWYYSGTNERSQWAQQEGDKPTHFRPLPAPPANSAELGGVDG